MKNYNAYHYIDLQLIDLDSSPDNHQTDAICAILQTSFNNLLEDRQRKVLTDNQLFTYLIKINYAIIANNLADNKNIKSDSVKRELEKVTDKLRIKNNTPVKFSSNQ